MIGGEDRDALGFEGPWIVKVYWDNEQIDENNFHIGKRVLKKLAVPEDEELGTYGANISLAKAFVKKKDIDKAVQYLKIAKSLDKQDPEAYVLLGAIYNTMKKSDKALLEFSKAKELKGDPFDVYRGLGLANMNLGLDDEAEENFAAALEITPGHEQVTKLLERVQNSSEATSSLDTDVLEDKVPGSSSDWDDPEGAWIKGGLFLNKYPVIAETSRHRYVGIPVHDFMRIPKPDIEDAEADAMIQNCSVSEEHKNLFGNMQKLLTLYRDCADDYGHRYDLQRSLGLIYTIERDYSTAINHLQASLRAKNDEPYTHRALGDAYLLSDESELAAQSYQVALDLAPAERKLLSHKLNQAQGKRSGNTFRSEIISSRSGFTIRNGLIAVIINRATEKYGKKKYVVHDSGRKTGPRLRIQLSEVHSKLPGYDVIKALEAELEVELEEKYNNLTFYPDQEDAAILQKVEKEVRSAAAEFHHTALLKETIRELIISFCEMEECRVVYDHPNKGKNVTEAFLKYAQPTFANHELSDDDGAKEKFLPILNGVELTNSFDNGDFLDLTAKKWDL